MGEIVRVPIKAETLRWAREALSLDVADLAKAAGTKEENVVAWEAGETQPTFVQLGKVAKKLGRTVATFLIDPPLTTGVPSAPDFRRQEMQDTDHPELARALLDAQQRKDTHIELSGQQALAITLPRVDWTNYEASADFVRSVITERSGLDANPGRVSYSQWIRALEDLGILVFQVSGVSSDVFRAASVPDPKAPFILVNSDDSDSGRKFSLFHELAHLMNKTGGMCDNLEYNNEEVLCNRFSSAFLMPRDLMPDYGGDIDPQNTVAQVSRRFRVSEYAAAVRLRALDMVPQRVVDHFATESQTNWARYKEQRKARAKKSKGPPHAVVRKSHLGELYLRTVFDAVESDRISILDASYYTDTRIPTLEKIRHEMIEAGSL